jgi:signal transduction histidine kinase
MDTLISNLLTLAREGERVNETRPVDLRSVVEACWLNVETADATLDADIDLILRADESRLQQLIENLIRNAVDHGGEGVTVAVGTLDDEPGFYVADDGPGIAPENRENVFDAGYSNSRGGTRFGLRIVQQVATAHGWDVAITSDAELGGARFEIRGIDVVGRTAKE